MGISRFDQQQQQASFKPMSFQELAYAPVQMRQREDRLVQAQDEMLGKLDNIVGYEGFDEETNAMKEELRGKLRNTINNIHNDGAGNQNHLADFGNLKRSYNQMVSETGALGVSSAVQEGIKSQKAAFFALAAKNNQHNPETVERNWQQELAKYTKSFEGKKIGDLKGRIPEMNIAPPPVDQDIPSRFASYTKMMGEIADQYKNSTFDVVEDENGKQQVVVRDVNGMIVTNQPNIDAVTEIMNNEIYDPKSAINQDLRWKGYTPEEIEAHIETLGRVALKQKSTESTESSIKAAPGGSRSSSSSSASTGYKAADDQASLRDLANASEAVRGSEHSESIARTMIDISRDTSMSDGEKQARLTQLRLARNIKQKVEDNPEFMSLLNKKIKDAFDSSRWSALKSTGVDSWEKYKSLNLDSEENRAMFNSGSKGDSVNIIDRIYEETAKELEMDHLVLAPTEVYTFGTGKGDKDLSMYLNENANRSSMQFMSAVDNGLVEAAFGGDMNYTDMIPGEADATKLSQVLNRPDAKFSLKSIHSGTDMTPPEIQYQVAFGKDGEYYDFTIDLEDNDFTNNLLSESEPLYQMLDAEGKGKIDAIRENIAYAGLATADPIKAERLDPNRPNEIFTQEQTNNILSHANKRNTELFGYVPKSQRNMSKVEQMAYDSQFVKNDGNKYAVVVNNDNSYSTYKRSPKGEEVPYTFDDYYKKELAASFVTGNLTNPNKYTEEYLDSPEGKTVQENSKIEILRGMHESASDIDNPETNMLLFSDDPHFRNVMSEFHKLAKEGESVFADPEKRKTALSLFGTLSRMKVNTRSKKYTL